jgi:hypothetical protein
VKELCGRQTGGAASPHGFRATLRIWRSEHGVPREVAEAMLAHKKQGLEAS